MRWNYSQDWNKIFGKKTLNIHKNVTKTLSFERERDEKNIISVFGTILKQIESKKLQFFNFKAESRKKVAAMRFLVCPFLRKICPTNLKNKKIKKIFSFQFFCISEKIASEVRVKRWKTGNFLDVKIVFLAWAFNMFSEKQKQNIDI